MSVRIVRQADVLIVLVGGIHVILLPGLWLLVRMADALGALGP